MKEWYKKDVDNLIKKDKITGAMVPNKYTLYIEGARLLYKIVVRIIDKIKRR